MIYANTRQRRSGSTKALHRHADAAKPKHVRRRLTASTLIALVHRVFFICSYFALPYTPPIARHGDA
jgi:hypothetical protein